MPLGQSFYAKWLKMTWCVIRFGYVRHQWDGSFCNYFCSAAFCKHWTGGIKNKKKHMLVQHTQQKGIKCFSFHQPFLCKIDFKKLQIGKRQEDKKKLKSSVRLIQTRWWDSMIKFKLIVDKGSVPTHHWFGVIWVGLQNRLEYLL